MVKKMMGLGLIGLCGLLAFAGDSLANEPPRQVSRLPVEFGLNH